MSLFAASNGAVAAGGVGGLYGLPGTESLGPISAAVGGPGPDVGAAAALSSREMAGPWDDKRFQAQLAPRPVPVPHRVAAGARAGAARVLRGARARGEALEAAPRKSLATSSPVGAPGTSPVLIQVDGRLCNPLCNTTGGVCARRPDLPWGAGGSPTCICQAPYAGPSCTELDASAVAASRTSQALLDEHYPGLGFRDGRWPFLHAAMTAIFLATVLAVCWLNWSSDPFNLSKWRPRRHQRRGPGDTASRRGITSDGISHYGGVRSAGVTPKRAESWTHHAHLQKHGSGRLDPAKVPQVVKDDSDEDEVY